MHKHSAQIELIIPFHDLDPMEVVWHGNYPRYFEQARCALLHSFDYDYPQMCASGYAWPVVDMKVRYVRPLQYMQRIVVKAELLEWENRMRIRYTILDAQSGERLTKGETVQVAVNMATKALCFISPAILFEKLGEAIPCGAP